MTLLLLPGARLPTARVVILRATATPLNCCRALRARPRLVQTVFLEGAARLAPLRVRTDYVGHTTMQRWRSPSVKGFMPEPTMPILLDIALPDSGGTATLDRLRTLRPDVPIIMVTANPNEALTCETRTRGAFDSS